MTLQGLVRCRSRGRAIVLAVALGATVAFLTPGRTVRAIEPTDSRNELDRPMADAAFLAPDTAGDEPRLLVLDAIDQAPGVATMRILERSGAWRSVAESSIDLGDPGFGSRWLVGLGTARFVLIARDETAGRSIVVDLQLGERRGGAPSIEETSRFALDRPVVDGGAADVDGDGTFELLLGTTPPGGQPCPGSELQIRDGTDLERGITIIHPGARLGAGVIGAFDEVPGDELLAYHDAACLGGLGAPTGTTVVAIRLLDAAFVFETPSGLRPGEQVGPPLRLDLDGDVPYEAVAMTSDGLSLIDPADGWARLAIGNAGTIVLAAGPDADASGPGVRLAWSEPAAGRIVAQRHRRSADGSVGVFGGSALLASEVDPARWSVAGRVVQEAAARHDPPVGWLGGLMDPGCPDLIVPLALLACDDDALRSGAAWAGTRPLIAIGDGVRRRLMVAAGLGWGSDGRLPPTPAPWAGGPAGWWRHGPSAPFAMSELRAGDTTYFREFPVPGATFERTTAPDGTTALSGFTGVRLFVHTRMVDGDELGGLPRPTLEVLDRAPPGALSRVVRVPVPPGAEAGHDGSYATVDLGRAAVGGGVVATRWVLEVVPLNDWGELGESVRGLVIRDAVGPRLSLDAPFTSPVWPFAARLTGSTEPGSTVVVDGFGPMATDRRGRFTLETTLAPWPQTLRVTATDGSGNVTVTDISVVGGIDYRRFPWVPIGAMALLVVVVAMGLRDARRAGDSGGRRSPDPFDDGPGAEIEELPPGGGLARR